MSKVHVVVVGTTPVRLVEKNPNRTFLHLVSTTAFYIGFNEGMTTDQECYLMVASAPLKLESYKGDIYAMTATATATVYYFEE